MAKAKIVKTEKPNTFNPITIQVTLETQAELNAIKAVTGLNIDVFKVVSKRRTNFTSNDLDDVFKAIYFELEKIVK